jgi:hypothetical protein
MTIHDFIVVGSGCTGAMAAQTLAEAGKNILILDGGISESHYRTIQPEKNFTELRRSDPDQHRYLLGDRFESLPQDEIGTGAQLTPARHYLVDQVDRYLPIGSKDFFPMESLALGGLGDGWGLGCCVFSENELQQAGLPPAEMHTAYQLVADRIGISSDEDDARPFTAAHIRDTQAAPPMDALAASLAKSYQSKKNKLNRDGFFLGRPALALLTREKNGRRPLGFRDMDFYDDIGKAAWRAWITIEEIRKKTNVQFEGGWLVTHFEEKENLVEVIALHLGTNEKRSFFCRKLVLAPGVLGTARIVLRSLKGGMETKLPLLCNPYTYMPCIVPSRLGKKNRREKLRLCPALAFSRRKRETGRYRDGLALHLPLADAVPPPARNAAEFPRRKNLYAAYRSRARDCRHSSPGTMA